MIDEFINTFNEYYPFERYILKTPKKINFLFDDVLYECLYIDFDDSLDKLQEALQIQKDLIKAKYEKCVEKNIKCVDTLEVLSKLK